MNDATANPPLSDGQRERLVAMADALMPAGEGLPAPSEVDVCGSWLDEALATVPTMAPAVWAALEVAGTPSEAIERLRVEQPTVFIAFSFALSGAYLMHPRVRHALGYEGPALQPKPVLEGEAEYYLEDGLLEPVINRGPIYRRVPEES